MFWDGLHKAIKAIKKICHIKRKTHISLRFVPNGALLLLTLPSMGLRRTWANSAFNTASIYSKSLQYWCPSISSSFCSLRFASVVRSLKSHSVWCSFHSRLCLFSRVHPFRLSLVTFTLVHRILTKCYHTQFICIILIRYCVQSIVIQ